MPIDPSRLYAALLNTGLQQKDNALYQVIYNLIGQLSTLNIETGSITGATGATGAAGINGPIGPMGAIIFPPDAEDGDPFPPIQGAPGAKGAQGISGAVAPGVTIDAGPLEIGIGIKGYRKIPQNGVIKRCSILSFQSGSIKFDIFKNPIGSFPPTTSIVGAAFPEIVGSNKYEDSTLTGWTTAVSLDDVLGFSVISNSGMKKCTLQLDIE